MTRGSLRWIGVIGLANGRHWLRAGSGRFSLAQLGPARRVLDHAGDRGLLHPELPAAATRDEAAELDGAAFAAYVSSNRTCELGMQQATGAPYRSIVQLLDKVTR
jgi:hypothetical protein